MIPGTVYIINGRRRKVLLSCSINNGNNTEKARGMTYIIVTIKPKSWVKYYLKKGKEGDRQIICLQHNNTFVHLKVDEAMEGGRSINNGNNTEKARGMTYIIVTIKPKSWVKYYLKKGKEGDRQIICLQHNNTFVHLKVDEAMEGGRRSHNKEAINEEQEEAMEGGRRSHNKEAINEEQERRRTSSNLYYICQAYCKRESSSNPTGPRRRYFQHAHFIPIVGVGKRGEY